MMQRYLLMGCLFPMLLAGVVQAQGTKLWTVDRYDMMERGTADGVGIRSDGRLEAGPSKQMENALLFNRRLWSIFMGAVESNDSEQTLEIRQNITNIGIFVLKQTVEMQTNPDPAKLKSLIDINCNLAAGLSGRA